MLPGSNAPWASSATITRSANVVDRAVNELRGTRAVATRYDKRDFVYRGSDARDRLSRTGAGLRR